MPWNGELAYVVGLLATDGNLSKDGRHIELTSKDIEQIENLAKILKLKNKIGTKSSGYSDKRYFRIQFGNVKFYRFLVKIGLTPNKTKTISKLKVPNKYFADFLRGHLDGDGYTTSFWDSIFKHSFRFYTGFVSASQTHLEWISKTIKNLYEIEGTIEHSLKARTYQLKYAKKASIKLMNIIYYKNDLICLQRKRLKILASLNIIKKHKIN